MKSFLAKNWFVIGIFAALAVGFAFPDAGIFLNTNSIFSTALIVLLFLISGLKLPSESIRTGMSDVRVHLYIQVFIFIVNPLFFYVTSLPFRGALDGQLVIGIYALACLPTTISSCIIFTQIAGGNVVATMFNAALANVAGILVSPLLLSLMMQSTGKPLPVAELLAILQSLALKMLLPIAIGQILRKFAKANVDKAKKRLSVLSNLFILMILFFAFAKTAKNPDFLNNLRTMIVPFIYLAVSYLILLVGSFFGARALKLDRENVISVLFAAPQKTLAMGVPLLSTFFAANPEILGIALLPLIFYHPWQLFVAGFLPRLLPRLLPAPGPKPTE